MNVITVLNFFFFCSCLGHKQISCLAINLVCSDFVILGMFLFQSSQSKFILEFLQCLAVSMTYLEKQTPVENTLDFAAKYCIYHESLVGEEDNVLLLAVFEFIFDVSFKSS